MNVKRILLSIKLIRIGELIRTKQARYILDRIKLLNFIRMFNLYKGLNFIRFINEDS